MSEVEGRLKFRILGPLRDGDIVTREQAGLPATAEQGPDSSYRFGDIRVVTFKHEEKSGKWYVAILEYIG